jgi:glycosyltransferase involved in cell wall biosynthesis
MPKVSVVMASYNHEKYVAETIESVLSQTYQDFEFIITDDGSPDGTVEVIKKFADSRIKLFCFSKNQGACTAMNNCIKEAKGEYIAVINSDDAWMPDKLEKQVKFLDEHPEKGAVFSYAEIIDEQGKKIPEENPSYTKVFIQPNRTRFEWLSHFFFKGNCLCHPSLLIRKHCYDDIGLYDERFAQLPDFDLWIRLCTRYEIYILSEKTIKFRILQDKKNVSSRTPQNLSRHFLEYVQILRNYLNPEILDNLVKIFDITTNVEKIGIAIKLREVEREIAPFFIAMLAQQATYPAHKYFSFDILYQFYANKELANKLKEQYFFDFDSLTNLAKQQDIFGIVALDKSNLELQNLRGELKETKNELNQCQTHRNELNTVYLELQRVLERSESQLHQTQRQLEESESQLHQTQRQLEESESQLHQTQPQLEQSESQLHQTQRQLEQSESQLHQTQRQLEQSESQLHQTRGELKRVQSQLYQAQVELDQSQAQLHQTDAVLQQSQTQLHQTEAVLQQSQAQLAQTRQQWEESQAQLAQTHQQWEESQAQLAQTRQQWEESQAQLAQTRQQWEESQAQSAQTHQQWEESQAQLAQTHQQWQESQAQLAQTHKQWQESQAQLAQTHQEVEQVKTQLHQTHQQLEESQAKLAQTQGQLQQQIHQQLDRSHFQQALSSQTNEEKQIHYQLLVRDAWYAYCNSDLTQMARTLQQSLKYTPSSKTETVVNWLESFAKFSLEKGYELDTESLTNLEEWKHLMRRTLAVKAGLTR